MEADNLIPDENIAGFSKRILEREYEEIAKMSVAVIVATAFDVIHEYREKGMTFDQIASAYTKNGVPMKGATLRWAFGRAMKSRKSLQGAPVARGDGGQRDAQPSPDQAPELAMTAPSPASVVTSPAPRPAAPAPKPMPVPGQKQDDERPRWMSEEMWAMKPKIDKILNTFPTPDREYPELAEKRFWTDSTGKKWDVRGPEKPANDGDRKSLDVAAIQHGHAWRDLMEKWGVVNIMPDTTLKPRYTIAEQYRRPLTVDLDELITKHLS